MFDFRRRGFSKGLAGSLMTGLVGFRTGFKTGFMILFNVVFAFINAVGSFFTLSAFRFARPPNTRLVFRINIANTIGGGTVVFGLVITLDPLCLYTGFFGTGGADTTGFLTVFLE
jgi:hypothetical protein